MSSTPVAAIVVTAMPEEAQPFLDVLEHREAEFAVLGGGQVWEMDSPAGRTILLRCGIGLVASASQLATVLARLGDEASGAVVISAGTTGGLGREVEVGDVCVSRSLAFTDADATAFGYAIGQTPGQPAQFLGDEQLVAAASGEAGLAPLRASRNNAGKSRIHVGQMLAGNSFVTAANVGATRETFPDAVSTDMESTALAQVAHSAGLRFASVRGVSDLCGPEAGQDFHIGADDAAARSAAVVISLLKQVALS